MSPSIEGPLAAELARDRTRYNAKFAAARWGRPALDAESFGAHLASSVDAVVRAVAAGVPERVSAVVDALYDASLELVGQDLAGPNARTNAVDRGWTVLLAAVPRLVAAAPAKVVASVSNAMLRLARAPSARPDDWMRSMIALDAAGASVDEWLEAGKVAAWRSGLPHARLEALDVCDRLSPSLAAVALGLGTASRVPAAVAALRANPWSWPLDGGPRLDERFEVGGFVPFGGVLLSPPKVVVSNTGALFAVDAQGGWEIHADAFGACLVRSRVDDAVLAGPSDLCLAGAVVRTGTRLERSLPHLAGASSWASNAHTLAAALPTSHWIHVIGLAS